MTTSVAQGRTRSRRTVRPKAVIHYASISERAPSLSMAMPASSITWRTCSEPTATTSSTATAARTCSSLTWARTSSTAAAVTTCCGGTSSGGRSPRRRTWRPADAGQTTAGRSQKGPARTEPLSATKLRLTTPIATALSSHSTRRGGCGNLLALADDHQTRVGDVETAGAVLGLIHPDARAGRDHHALVDDRPHENRAPADVDTVHEHAAVDLRTRVHTHTG